MADLDLPTTDQWRDRYLRDFKLRMPTAQTGRGTQPYVDAVTFSGMTPGLLKNAVTAANRALIASTFGEDLDEYGTDHGHPRNQGSGSFGTIIIETGITGATYTNGATLKHKDTGEPYAFVGITGAYQNGASLPVQSTGLGRQTNANPGDVLLWDTPPAGSLPSVTVENVNGKGLIGGSDVESDADFQKRLQGYEADPPADGNEGHYIQLVEDGTHGVPVEQAYVYPAILGPGTVGVTFTVRGTGITRIPTAPQLAAVETFLHTGVVPFDDSIFMIALSANGGTGQTPIVGVKFLATETGFIDPDPFPRLGNPVGVTKWTIAASPSPTADQFAIENAPGTSYTNSGVRVGQTLAVWNDTTKTFVRKRIQTIEDDTGPIEVTIDNTGGSSDLTYVPVVGQLVCPWSDKINQLAQVVVDYYDTLGPGENTTPLPDPGRRMRRYPADSIQDPMGVTTRMVDGISDRPDVQSVVVHAGLTSAPTPGTAGVNSFLFILTDLAFYPLP